jgi:lipoate-protein ligase A
VGNVREIRVERRSFGPTAAMDAAVSAALLEAVSAGEAVETLRLFRPPTAVVFGSHDRVSAGFAEAVRAARAEGFEAALRLAGGRAAVFHEGTIGFAWSRPEREPKAGIRARFEEISGLVAEALRDVGVDARVGEVPGEYCPGAYSVNAAGRRKLMGVGQRLAAGASHVGGVIVVGGADRIRNVLQRVYEALAIAWDPTTVGAVEDEHAAPGWETVADALLRALARRRRIVDGEIEPAVVARAPALVDRYDPGV